MSTELFEARVSWVKKTGNHSLLHDTLKEPALIKFIVDNKVPCL